MTFAAPRLTFRVLVECALCGRAVAGVEQWDDGEPTRWTKDHDHAWSWPDARVESVVARVARRPGGPAPATDTARRTARVRADRVLNP